MSAINERPGDSQLDDVGTEADDPSNENESLEDSTAADAQSVTQAAAEPTTAPTPVRRSANMGHT